jgi:hypothetical protein
MSYTLFLRTLKKEANFEKLGRRTRAFRQGWRVLPMRINSWRAGTRSPRNQNDLPAILVKYEVALFGLLQENVLPGRSTTALMVLYPAGLKLVPWSGD